jgi:hypothetical protein
MISKTSGVVAEGAAGQVTGAQGPASPAGRVRGALGVLFPAADGALRSWRARLLSCAVQIVLVAIGAGALLLRISGLPSWDSLFMDDWGVFFSRAVDHPWQLFSAQHGYVQVLPHIVASIALYVPLIDVPKVFALSGAIIAAACGVYVFHASEGHIKSVWIRVLLGLAIALLPTAPLEIADNSLGAPWYMMLALFWGVLWRPRTIAGYAATALLAFMTAASTTIAVFFAPILLARLFVLRRPREHVVTIAWFLGCLVQVPTIISTYLGGSSPLGGVGGGGLAEQKLGKSMAFYGHDVVLPSLGWHLSWWLQDAFGRDGATILVGAMLVVALSLVVVTQPQNRLFVLIAVLLGFVITIFSTTLTPYNTTSPPVTISAEPGARYTALPIFLLESALFLTVDYALRKGRSPGQEDAATGRQGWWTARRLAALPAMLLVLVTVVSWVPDFRYYNALRYSETTGSWADIINTWRLYCAVSPTGVIDVQAMQAMPGDHWLLCDRLHFPTTPPFPPRNIPTRTIDGVTWHYFDVGRQVPF